MVHFALTSRMVLRPRIYCILFAAVFIFNECKVEFYKFTLDVMPSHLRLYTHLIVCQFGAFKDCSNTLRNLQCLQCDHGSTSSNLRHNLAQNFSICQA